MLSSCSSDPEIHRCCAMTHSAMQSLDWHLWRSRIMTETKFHLYRVFMLPMMLYGFECWAINKVDLQWIDALDQWCLWRILGIRWHDFVRNADVHHMTISHHSHPLSSLVVFLSLGILWELMKMWTPAKSFLSLLARAGDVHLGGHVLPGWRPSKVISFHWIWSCMRPENWLRIDLSGDWCLCIALHTHSGACYYWIGGVLITSVDQSVMLCALSG